MLTGKKFKLSNLFIHLTFEILALSCIVPLILVVVVSFSDRLSIVNRGYTLFPQAWSLDAYKYIFKSPELIAKSYMTTIFVTIVGTSIGLIFTAMIAYALSRKDYKLAGFISFLVFFSMLFNAGMIPNYIIFTKYYHLKDSYLILILPGLVSGWNIILMRTFFYDISTEVLESASIDGSSELRTFWQIAMPMSKPALGTIGLVMALGYWNDWARSLLYIDTDGKMMLQFLLYKILRNAEIMLGDQQIGTTVGEYNIPTDTAKMAMAVIAAGPMMFVFPFFQKYFVRGLSSGAVKG